jgi:hypothetical protein
VTVKSPCEPKLKRGFEELPRQDIVTACPTNATSPP